jgi:hypothetical protein
VNLIAIVNNKLLLYSLAPFELCKEEKQG